MKKIIKLSFAAVAAVSNICAQDIYDMGLITVSSATKTEQSIKDVTSNVEVITSTELEEKHVSTVSDALKLVNGLDVVSNGGMGKSSSVFLRGFDSKRTLVMIDGIRYNDPTGLSGAPYEHLMMTDIEKIEIVKGAQSGVWGADATAGVINIITKGVKKGLHGTLGAEFGSFNTRKYSLGASYGDEKIDLSLSQYRVSTDGFSAKAVYGNDIDIYEDDEYRNTTSNVKVGYKFDDKNSIKAAYTLIDAKTDTDPFGNPNGDSPILTRNSFKNISYENKNDLFQTNVYAQRSDFQREYPLGWTKEYDGSVDEYGVKVSLPYMDKTSFISTGVDRKVFEHENSFNKKYANNGFFLTNSNRFNEKTVVTESVRVDRYDKFENKTTGKIGIKHDINDDLNIKANIGTAYNVPTIYNLYDPTYGNTNLTPESSTSYDIGFGYKDVQITYFYNKIKDMIDFDMTAWKYYNATGTSTLKGWELSYEKEFMGDTLFNFSYTRLDAQNNQKEDLARRAKDNIKFGIDYYGIEKLHLGINGEYTGTRYDKDNKQGRQTGKYTVANFVVNYDLTKDVKIYGKINNITDKYYQTIDGYATSPRAYYAGIKVSF